MRRRKAACSGMPLGTRADSEPVPVTLPSKWDTEGLAVYVFVLSPDKRKASGTVYLTPQT